ncbi:hypothetical protein MARPO_0091s0057 [Marchantia polymorpha]|uniref:Uncharacterized protein n=1 Tax=Marchantia polymorpha TaxID=3197 RepID=A0A2R6WH72_MARPO|nr:hypothetical protein MARPO_0091s0057 [Marchantia polymorpha]PTQ33207.1 hypothetical protein MARPO_0091s0057 [Marchantia polymorpha]|eukprot:PTQ33206.1 hypothetical protein MARPO_0091s0057 [Marchantia polymorpha]
MTTQSASLTFWCIVTSERIIVRPVPFQDLRVHAAFLRGFLHRSSVAISLVAQGSEATLPPTRGFSSILKAAVTGTHKLHAHPTHPAGPTFDVHGLHPHPHQKQDKASFWNSSAFQIGGPKLGCEPSEEIRLIEFSRERRNNLQLHEPAASAVKT